MIMRNVTFLFRKAPYGSVNNVEGFRLCTALAAMEIYTNAVFIDDGVFVALRGQDPKGIGLPPIDVAYGRLVSLEVKVYILEEALKERGISKEQLIDIECRLINREQLAELISESDFTLSF